MAIQIGLADHTTTLNKLIDSAAELPPESQGRLLVIAKSLLQSRSCIIGHRMLSQSNS